VAVLSQMTVRSASKTRWSHNLVSGTRPAGIFSLLLGLFALADVRHRTAATEELDSPPDRFVQQGAAGDERRSKRCRCRCRSKRTNSHWRRTGTLTGKGVPTEWFGPSRFGLPMTLTWPRSDCEQFSGCANVANSPDIAVAGVGRCAIRSECYGVIWPVKGCP